MKSVVGVCRPENIYVQDMLYMDHNIAFVMDARKQLALKSRHNDSWCHTVHDKLVDACLQSYEENEPLLFSILKEFSTGKVLNSSYASFGGVIFHDKLSAAETAKLTRLRSWGTANSGDSVFNAGLDAYEENTVDIVLTGNTVAMLLYHGKQLVLRGPLCDTGEIVRLMTDYIAAKAMVSGMDFVDVLNTPDVRAKISKYNAATSQSKNRCINLMGLDHNHFLMIRKSVDELKRYVISLGTDCSSVKKTHIFDSHKVEMQECEETPKEEVQECVAVCEMDSTYAFGECESYVSEKNLYGCDLLEEVKLRENKEQRIARQGQPGDYSFNTRKMPFKLVDGDVVEGTGWNAGSEDLEIYLMSDGFYQAFEYGIFSSAQEMSDLLKEGVCPTWMFTRLADRQNEDILRNELPRLHHTDDMTLIKIVI